MSNKMNYSNVNNEMDLMDLCGVIIAKWRWILLGSACGLLIAVGLTALKPKESIDEEIVASRLSEQERNYVEDLQQSYYIANRKLDVLRSYLASPEINSLQLSEDDRVMKRTYYVVNSPINGFNYVVSETILKPEDYAQLSLILYGDEEHATEAAQHVMLTCMTDSERQEHIALTNHNNQTLMEGESNGILILTVIGPSKEKTEEASTYAENLIVSKKYSSGVTDDLALVSFIDSQYSDNQTAIVQALYADYDRVSTSMYNAESQLNNLQTNYISKLSQNSKLYYSILNGEKITAAPKNYKRNGVLGLIIGFVTACGWLLLQYILDGTVKTSADIAWILNGDRAYELSCRKKQTKNDSVEILTAEDIAIKLKRKGKKKLFISACKSAAETELIQKVISAIKERFDGHIIVGDPSEYAEDMRQLSESDAVIMVVPLKQEQFSKVFETEQLCRGYGSEIIGVITM